MFRTNTPSGNKRLCLDAAKEVRLMCFAQTQPQGPRKGRSQEAPKNVAGCRERFIVVLCVLQTPLGNIQGITKPAIRRLARRGGVKRISGLISSSCGAQSCCALLELTHLHAFHASRPGVAPGRLEATIVQPVAAQSLRRTAGSRRQGYACVLMRICAYMLSQVWPTVAPGPP